MRTIVSLLAATFLSLGVASAATLRIVEATNDVVPKDFKTITLQLIDWVKGRQQPVPIRSVDAVMLSNGADLTKYFALRSDGSLSANDDAVADEILAGGRSLRIQFRGVDGDGIPRTLWTEEFWLGARPADDGSARQKINTFWFRLVDRVFQPVLVQDIVWPEPLDNLTERQLQAFRRRGRVGPDSKLITVLAYDSQGNVIFRTMTMIAFSMQVEHIGSGTSTIADPKPTFSVNVPLGVSRLEIVAWDGQPGATFDVQKLTADPRLRTDELLRQ